MIGTIRKCRICTKGGILAAILVAAVFTSSQVTCLTHSHCEGPDCFEHREDHGGHEAGHECGHEAGSSCEGEHEDQDIHHHSHDGKTHPKRRFTVPVEEPEYADAVSEEAPVFTSAQYLPVACGSPPFEIYGLIFAERAPPLS